MKFNTFVIIMHQLSGACNEKGQAAELSHTDGDECKSVGMYVDYAFTVTAKTDDGLNHVVMRCTKSRHQGTHPPIVVKIVGEYNQLKDDSKKYTVEGRRIISREERDRVFKPKGGGACCTLSKPKITGVVGIEF